METKEKVVPLTREDYLSMQVAYLRDGQKEIRAELKDTRTELKETRRELNARMDKLEEKLDTTRRELNERIDKLADKIDTSANHGTIANISTVGIALAVIYSLLR